MADPPSTRDRILDVTRRQLFENGMSRLTLQSIADEIGVTKQAVLYWFPSKTVLLRELFVEALEAEAAVLTRAVEDSEDAAGAIENFLRRGMAYHREHLPRFRLTYLVAQIDPSISSLTDEDGQARIYAATTRLYDSLEAKLAQAPGFPGTVNARNFGVSLHMSLLGHVCLHGSMEALGDSFKQTFDEMLDALAGILRTALADISDSAG
jgi:AcrR family transcriptional regulator